MGTVNSIAFALDPTNIPAFLLDWELTKLCNLNCSYCLTGLDGGHDNTTKHPPLADCLESIDFMYAYANKYMKYKKPTQRRVILNIYGGESLFHPDIVEILEACKARHTPYKDLWNLTITCTTNAVVGKNLWERIVPLVDEFSVSYHSENLPKQKQQYLDNILYLKEHNKKFKCIIMMHNDAKMFSDSEQVVAFCKINEIRYLTKPLDNVGDRWTYTQDQFTKITKKEQPIQFYDTKVNSIQDGRQCCGGRRMSLNGDLKSNVGFVPKQGFEGWSCSVNWFFLFVRQLDGAVYTNKDCKTSTSGKIEPLGYLSDTAKILSTLQNQLDNKAMPIIQCVKAVCRCGFCSPKAETKEDFMALIKRNVPDNIFQH